MIASLLTATLLSTPLSAESIAGLAASSDRLQTLVEAVGAAGLGETLTTEGPFTVFAPTNAAFARIDQDTLTAVLNEPGHGTLKMILLNHVVAGSLDAEDLLEMESVETLGGDTLPLSSLRGRLLVGDSVVESANIKASNGVVHIIDRVLLPELPQDPLQQILERAVTRGVPLYNNGSPEACCAVYATALEAITMSEGWGLTPAQTKNIRSALSDAESIKDLSERAWAYRRIIDALFNETMTRSMKVDADTSSTTNVVFDFENPRQTDRWQVVLDGVMGGLSTGYISNDDGTMVFTGETSLRNNGGFSSVRANVEPGAFSGADEIRLRVKGDGRTWILGTSKRRGRGADSYWTRFETVDGEWQTVTIPIAGMERHWYGQKMQGSITGDEINAVSFYIYDKKAGPFSLEVESIEARAKKATL